MISMYNNYYNLIVTNYYRRPFHIMDHGPYCWSMIWQRGEKNHIMDQKGGNQANHIMGPLGFMIHDMERDGKIVGLKVLNSLTLKLKNEEVKRKME